MISGSFWTRYRMVRPDNAQGCLRLPRSCRPHGRASSIGHGNRTRASGTSPATALAGPALPSEPMNATPAIHGEVARLVREHVVEEVDDAIHGATFDGRRLVLA